MELDLKRVARLEYLKLRQSKQVEKVDAVKVSFILELENVPRSSSAYARVKNEVLSFLA